ncbi:MAG: hypothetical protein V1736_03495 [Pseudomonadota bacterium]
MGALSVGDVRTGTIPSLLPSQKHYLEVYRQGDARTFNFGCRISGYEETDSNWSYLFVISCFPD